MNESNWTYRLCFKQLDNNQIVELLWNQREELFLDEKSAAAKIVDLLFEHGGAIGAFDPTGKLQGLIGFFFGDPTENYANKETLFIYVAAISKKYRHSLIFFKGLMAIAKQSKQLGIDNFKMQASLTDRHINRLYSKFAQPLGEDKNIRGYPVMSYGGSMDAVLAKFESRIQSVPYLQS